MPKSSKFYDNCYYSDTTETFFADLTKLIIIILKPNMSAAPMYKK